MKEGLVALSAYQVASLRIVSSGIVLLPSAIRHFKVIPKDKLMIIFMSGVLGSLLPAYLFCIAEEGIDSALAGTLNSLTPIFVIITGALFFKSTTTSNKIWGIIISFAGSILLLFSKGHMQESQNLMYISFVVLATIFYGFNVNRYVVNFTAAKISITFYVSKIFNNVICVWICCIHFNWWNT